MGHPEIEAFLIQLAVDRRAAPARSNQALLYCDEVQRLLLRLPGVRHSVALLHYGATAGSKQRRTQRPTYPSAAAPCPAHIALNRLCRTPYHPQPERQVNQSTNQPVNQSTNHFSSFCGTNTSSRQRLRKDGRTSASGDCSVSPPSAVSTMPVTNDASSDARKRMQLAISSG